MTKFTLLAAASVAAMAFAGAANADVITASINAQAVTNTAGVTAPYTIASERNNVVDNSSGSTITNTLTSAITVAGGSTQNYQVTFNIAGGNVPTTTTASLAVVGVANGGSATVAAGARTANSISFIVTVSGVGMTGYVINGFTLTADLQSPSTEPNITAGGSVSLLAGGVTTVVDTAPVVTIVQYAAVIGTLSVTSNNAIAALPDFKLFAAGTTPSAPISGTPAGQIAEIASNFVYTNSVTNNAGGLYYGGLASAAVTRAGLINGGVVGFAGSIPAGMLASLQGVTVGNITSTVTNANSAVFTLNDGGADEFIVGGVNAVDVLLTQPPLAANRNTIPAGFYTTTFAPTVIGGYTAPSPTTVNSGTVSLDGVNFIAPWIAGPQSGQQTVIRLSSGSSTASGGVTLRLLSSQARAPGVTTGPGAAIANQTCSTSFSIPANGELQITGATLTTCFGQFLRGDLQITIQSSSTALTAKARNVDAAGDVFEQTLGRFSGSASAAAVF